MNKIFITIIVIFFLGFAIFSNKKDSSNNLPQQDENQEIVIKGSDTEVQMVSNLAEQFAFDNPQVNISVTGGGSSVGIAALINGEVMVANSSRALKEEELSLIAERGIDLKTIIVARDGLSVIVNQNNSIEELSIDQLADIYSGKITNWVDVGGNDSEISLYGRQSTSGTYGFFRESVIQGDYAASMKGMEGNQAIIDGVVNDTEGIGYVGVGYLKDDAGNQKQDVKVIPLISSFSEIAISPFDTSSVKAGLYPLFRPIYQFINGNPAPESDLKKFLEFEISPAGQDLVIKAGFFQITADDEKANAEFD